MVPEERARAVILKQYLAQQQQKVMLPGSLGSRQLTRTPSPPAAQYAQGDVMQQNNLAHQGMAQHPAVPHPTSSQGTGYTTPEEQARVALLMHQVAQQQQLLQQLMQQQHLLQQLMLQQQLMAGNPGGRQLVRTPSPPAYAAQADAMQQHNPASARAAQYVAQQQAKRLPQSMNAPWTADDQRVYDAMLAQQQLQLQQVLAANAAGMHTTHIGTAALQGQPGQVVQQQVSQPSSLPGSPGTPAYRHSGLLPPGAMMDGQEGSRLRKL
jgi:hypothetical protein